MGDREAAEAREMAADEHEEVLTERDELRAALKKAVAHLESRGDPPTMLVGYRDLIARTGHRCEKRNPTPPWPGARCCLREDHEGKHQGWGWPSFGEAPLVEWPR
jgi:hypothetical protein